MWMKKIIILFSIFVTSVNVVYAQYMYGTTGLLQMPTAEMQRDKTFMFGGSALSPQIIPSQEWWGNYYTINYYINITIFPWLEVGYDCVLVKAKSGIYHWVPDTYGKFVNQDRSFHGRLRVWKEGWWKSWTPQIVVGLNDPTSGSWEGGSSSDDQRYNGFFVVIMWLQRSILILKKWENLAFMVLMFGITRMCTILTVPPSVPTSDSLCPRLPLSTKR